MERYFEKISFEQFKEDISEDPALYGDLKTPKRGTKNSAGYDFFSPANIEIMPGRTFMVPTGIKASMLEDEVLQIYIRSSLGIKKNIVLSNQVGVIDSDYYNNEKRRSYIYRS